MIKKAVLFITLIAFSLPVFAEEINLTPRSDFSGFNNTSARPKYPQLKKSLSASEIVEQEEIDSVMSPKSVKQMSSSETNRPMSYNQFPQNYDSSNSMMMMQGIQNGIQNMYMGL